MSEKAPLEVVIDAHINLASTKFIPRKFIEHTALNMYNRISIMGEKVPKARFMDMVFSLYEDHFADKLIKEMDEAGIAIGILLAPDFSKTTECQLTNSEIVECHREIAKRHPGRFKLFVGADPRTGKEGLDLFESAVIDHGFCGLKIYPPSGYSPSDPSLFPYYEICAARKLPVLTHTGPGWHSLSFSMGHPMLLDEASRQFPGVNFIMGHGGVAYVDDASYLCMYRENVYMDISGFIAVNDPRGWQSHLNDIFKVGINHKIVFGTSWPAFRMSTNLPRIMSEFSNQGTVFNGIKKKDKKLIMSGNISRLLSMEEPRVVLEESLAESNYASAQ